MYECMFPTSKDRPRFLSPSTLNICIEYALAFLSIGPEIHIVIKSESIFSQ